MNQEQLNKLAQDVGYKGTFSNVGLSSTTPPMQNPNANYFQQTTTQAQSPTIQYQGNSIVDALNQSGQPSDFASRTKLAQQYGIQGYTGTADQNLQLLNKYKTGFQQAKQSGTVAPKTQGEGSAMVNSFTGGTTPMPTVNPIDQIIAQDKGYQDMLKTYQDFTSSQKQQESLTSMYDRLSKESGLEGINTQLINSKRIIDGTEQDIRNEISAVGGFATESQVQALAGARNKTLIANYNTLVDTANNIQNRINTMVGLSKEDRAYAQQNFENQLQFQQQMQSYKDKFINNAKESYNAIIKAQGYAGLYNSLKDNPSELAMVEKTLGLQQGQLAQLSTYKEPLSEKDKLDLELKKQQIETEKAQRSNIYSQISERNKQVLPESVLLTPQQSNDPFIKKILSSKGGKAMADTSIQKLDKGLTVLGQLGSLQTNIQNVKTGPITGAFKGSNPWDTNAQVIKAQLNSIVPNLARGIYGEVGVLTDNDIKQYAKTLPNLKSTEDVRNAILYITLDTISKSIKNTLNVNASAGRDVSGFVDIYTEMENTKNSILQTLPLDTKKINDMDKVLQ